MDVGIGGVLGPVEWGVLGAVEWGVLLGDAGHRTTSTTATFTAEIEVKDIGELHMEERHKAARLDCRTHARKGGNQPLTSVNTAAPAPTPLCCMLSLRRGC